jgi:hypothetical protein
MMKVDENAYVLACSLALLIQSLHTNHAESVKIETRIRLGNLSESITCTVRHGEYGEYVCARRNQKRLCLSPHLAPVCAQCALSDA